MASMLLRIWSAALSSIAYWFVPAIGMAGTNELAPTSTENPQGRDQRGVPIRCWHRHFAGCPAARTTPNAMLLAVRINRRFLLTSTNVPSHLWAPYRPAWVRRRKLVLARDDPGQNSIASPPRNLRQHVPITSAFLAWEASFSPELLAICVRLGRAFRAKSFATWGFWKRVLRLSL